MVNLLLMILGCVLFWLLPWIFLREARAEAPKQTQEAADFRDPAGAVESQNPKQAPDAALRFRAAPPLSTENPRNDPTPKSSKDRENTRVGWVF